MEILAQLKASDPKLGAVGLDGVEVVMEGVRGTSRARVQISRPFRGVCVFSSDPKSLGDGFWGGAIKPK